MLTDPLLQAIESDTVWLESCNFCNLHKLWVQLNAYNLLNLIKDILNLAGFRETKNIHPLYIVHITIRSVWVCIYIPLYLRVYITCVYIIYMCMYTSILYYSYIYIYIYMCVCTVQLLGNKSICSDCLQKDTWRVSTVVGLLLAFSKEVLCISTKGNRASWIFKASAWTPAPTTKVLFALRVVLTST